MSLITPSLEYFRFTFPEEQGKGRKKKREKTGGEMDEKG
jgi:hypothetical protein